MMLYTSGKQVTYQGQIYVVDSVHLRGFELIVWLQGMDHGVPSDEVFCEPTEISLSRS